MPHRQGIHFQQSGKHFFDVVQLLYQLRAAGRGGWWQGGGFSQRGAHAQDRAGAAHGGGRGVGSKENFARLVSPIGGATVKDKRPAVIAALVVAELLAVYASLPGASS